MDGNDGRRHVDRSRSGGDHDGSGVSRRNHHLGVGGGGGLGAGHSLILVVGTGTKADIRATGNAHIEAGASAMLAIRAGATGSVVLTVGASAVVDSRTTGNTDVETGTGIMLAVAVGRRSVGVGVVTTKERKAVLGLEVSLSVVKDIHVVRNIPAEEQRRRKRGQWPERGIERPRRRKCWKALRLSIE